MYVEIPKNTCIQERLKVYDSGGSFSTETISLYEVMVRSVQYLELGKAMSPSTFLI